MTYKNHKITAIDQVNGDIMVTITFDDDSTIDTKVHYQEDPRFDITDATKFNSGIKDWADAYTVGVNQEQAASVPDQSILDLVGKTQQ